ncbi:RE1 [Symbiodinium sp. CCMP2456]|nr:RE1 [Symbiodinium sp. CCMP2456]
MVKEDKWSRVDKRATSMLLASLPESVRTEILASRLTGALQVLGRVMVLYRPGSTAERQQILKALELPAVASTAAEAVDALRRWARWLRRAGDVGLQSPDPSILLRGLDGMVNSEILFRINMMRYTLEVDVKPTQKAVEDLHQALLSEFEQANSMLKEMRQLRMLTVHDVTASAKALGMDPECGRTGLLDSGASHPYRPGTEEEISAATTVRVQLANGEEVALAQSPTGTLLARKASPDDLVSPIVPLGSLVQDLNCELTWGRRRGLEIKHPLHGTIRPKVVGPCPLIGEAQELELIRELEEKRVDDLQRSTAAMQRSLWTWDHGCCWSRHLEVFLDDGTRSAQLLAMEAKDSPFVDLEPAVKGSLAEEVSLTDKAGWNYLKALPISRRKRKQLMSSTWLLNLFAGGVEGTSEFKTLEDGAVLVEIDILRSKAFDFKRAMGAYRAVLWAAATGRIKGILASPPMRTRADEELLAKTMWCSLTAKAARVARGDSPPFVMIEGVKIMNYMNAAAAQEKPTGLQRAWPRYLEAMWIDRQYEALVSNLDGLRAYHYDYIIKIWEMDNGVQGGNGQGAGTMENSLAEQPHPLQQKVQNVRRIQWYWEVQIRTMQTTGSPWWASMCFRRFKMKYEMGVHTQMKYEMGVHTQMKYEMGVHTQMKYEMRVHTQMRYEMGVHTQMKYEMGVHTQMKYEMGVFYQMVVASVTVAYRFMVGRRLWKIRVIELVLCVNGRAEIFSQVGGVEGYKVIYVMSPLRSRTTKDVLAATQDLYLRLRAHGCPILRVHSDRARELRSDPLKRWLASRGTYTTYTEGQSPQANGRAEAAVKYAKTQTKRLLTAANFAPRLWPVALRYAMWAQMQKQLYPDKELVPFGTRVHVKRKVYGAGGRYDLESRWGTGYYVGPSADVNEGSVMMMDKGNLITTSHMRPGLFDADREIELEDHHALVSVPSRRLRRKSMLDPGDNFEGVPQPLPPQDDGGESQGPAEYDPNDPIEEFARAVLREGCVDRDLVESLARLLPLDGKKPKRFGVQDDDEAVWVSGAFVHGGVVGVLNNARRYPLATKVFTNYIHNKCPGFKFNSVAVFKGIKAEPHKDAHNVGVNAVMPLTDFEGCDVIVVKDGSSTTLKVNEGQQFFDPHDRHYTTPCTKGASLMLVGYSIRDSAKLNLEMMDYLTEVGFDWDPHRASEGADQGEVCRLAMVMMNKAQASYKEKEKTDTDNAADAGQMDYANADLDVAIQDLEDRAARLRDLLEEEEIMAEQAARLGQTVRDELGDARDYVCKYLDDVHKQLMQFQCLRERVFLRSARTAEEGAPDIDYEKLLDELEGDLDIVHTVPLDQVKRVLHKWTGAIEKEVKALFDSGTLVKIPYAEAKTLEAQGSLKIVPAKCVFTLKPPNTAGGKCRRKCRMVICGNFITRNDGEDQASLYAAGTSTDALRLALTVASSRLWLAAIADITSAFLLAEWPAEMPKYALMQPKVIRESGDFGGELWMVQRPLYGLRESPMIWSEFRNMKLRQIKVVYKGRRLGLRQATSESELWLLRDEESNELWGLLVAYVDDLIDWVDAEHGVRYLGVEIKQDPGSKTFSISQQAYITELLRAHNMQDTAHTQLPVPREWLESVELDKDEELPFTDGDLKLGQRYVGEAVWLATKTRPDILYSVNAMASNVAKKPLQVIRMGERLLSYLAGTADLELKLVPPQRKEPLQMTCFTDASFAPFGARSYGAAVVVYGSAPVSWKAGKQSFVTMSTMVLAIDNSSAVAMCAGGPGSQRTREEQLADLATKLVTKERLWKLLGLWGFVGGRIAKAINALKVKMMAFVVMLVSMARPADGRVVDNPDKEAIQVSGWDELVVVGLLICVAAIACWELMKHVARFAWKQYKSAKKTMKMQHVKRVAAEAARKEIEEAMQRSGEQLLSGHSSSSTSAPRRRSVGFHSKEESLPEPQTPPLRAQTSPFTSPGVPSEEEAYLPQERERVIKDTLSLMTTEGLKEALRCVGLLVSGLKCDQVARLVPVLGVNEPRAGSSQPSTKQLKYVLWLWRVKSLSGRVILGWHDIATRSEISRWIQRWKST